MSESVAPRDVLGETLTRLAEKKPNLVVLDADFNPASKITQFKDQFPDRFIQVGIAEQNMMGIAAGLATLGLAPFACSIAAFCSRRACDQVVTSIALQGLNVKILGVYPGLFVGKNGGSHQSLEDIALMRAVATMAVAQPVDGPETIRMLEFAADYVGPMYIRIGRDPVPTVVPEDYKFELGKSVTLREGNDITLIAAGEVMEDTLEAAASLGEKGIHARVINMSSIKPIDQEAIIKAAEETGKIVTVENHSIFGGLGSAVCEVTSEFCPVKVKRVGVRNVFGRSGSNEEMKKKFGLTVLDIENTVRALLGEAPRGTGTQKEILSSKR